MIKEKTREKVGMCKKALSQMLFMFVMLVSPLLASAQVKVVDAESGDPVCYASVFDDASGKVLGITSSEGFLPSSAESCKTISVQHINYEPTTVAVSSIEGNTIKLASREAYQVPEVAVPKTDYDFMRLKIYVRQYTIMNGTVAAVSESLNYGFYDVKKQKLKEHLMLSEKLMRNESLFEGQPKLIMRAGRITNSLPGGNIIQDLRDIKTYDDGKRHMELYPFGHHKWYTAYVKHDDKAKRIEYIRDSVYVDKPFNLKILGVTLSDGYFSSSFSSAYGKPSLSTWQNKLAALRMTHNKTQSSVNKYIEMYVLDADYADKADYKALKKELEEKKEAGTLEPFVRPEGFPDFNKYVTNAMKSMTVVSE